MRHNNPRDASNGRNFEDTLFGAILSVSSIVKNEQGPYDFFDRPSRYTKKEHDITEQSIHQVRKYPDKREKYEFICIN